MLGGIGLVTFSRRTGHYAIKWKINYEVCCACSAVIIFFSLFLPLTLNFTAMFFNSRCVRTLIFLLFPSDKQAFLSLHGYHLFCGLLAFLVAFQILMKFETFFIGFDEFCVQFSHVALIDQLTISFRPQSNEFYFQLMYFIL